MKMNPILAGALASVTLVVAGGLSHVHDTSISNHRPVHTASARPGQWEDAKVVCTLTRKQWQGLCERVWTRPAFGWKAYGQHVADQAGPLLVIDSFGTDPRSVEAYTSLKGYDADWADAKRAARQH